MHIRRHINRCKWYTYVCICHTYKQMHKNIHMYTYVLPFTLHIQNVSAFLRVYITFTCWDLQRKKGICQQHMLENFVSQCANPFVKRYFCPRNNGSTIHTKSKKPKLKFEFTEMYTSPFSSTPSVQILFMGAFYMFFKMQGYIISEFTWDLYLYRVVGHILIFAIQWIQRTTESDIFKGKKSFLTRIKIIFWLHAVYGWTITFI